MLEPYRFSYIKGVMAFIAMIISNFLLWRIFFAPSDGFFKLFTPMYGLALVAAYFFIIVVIVDIFEYKNEQNNIGQGFLLLSLSFVLLGVVFYGFFWNFLGRLGIAYFSPYALISAGGTGAEMWNMRENSSTAILYLLTAFVFVATAWNVGFDRFPWSNHGGEKIKTGISKLFGMSFFTMIVYAIFFHPHITALFVPKQVYAGVAPWWEEAAMTSSAFYHLGWMFASIFVLLLSQNTFGGWPWNVLKKDGQGTFLSGAAAVLVSVMVGFVLMYGMEAIMTYYWYEPFTGGNYTDDPRFRHLHVAEISAFFILALLIGKVYFNNWPNKFGSWLNNLICLGLVLGSGMLIWWFYYSQTIGPAYVNRVPGIGNVDATSLCWTIMSITIVLVHEKFFNAFPLRRSLSE